MLSCAGERRKPKFDQAKFDQAIENTKKNIENTLKMTRDSQLRRVPEFITIIDEIGEEVIVFYD
jgi:hypothetical protein